MAGHQAVMRVRLAKTAAALEAVIRRARAQAFIDGVAEAQHMTGFTDETVKVVLAKAEYPVNDTGGFPFR